MEFNIYPESSFWRSARLKRLTRFIRITTWVMMIFSTTWLFLTIREGIYLLSMATIINLGMGILILFQLSRKRLNLARMLLVITAGLYYVLATAFASGYGSNHGTAHYGFIVLSVVSYFILYDRKPWRDVFPALYLVLFFLYHFGYAPFYPLITLPAERLFWISRFDILTTIVLIYFTTRQFVAEITSSEEALAATADKLEGLLESMLPKNIADRLRKEGKTFADEFHECSVLFADIVGFTSWSAGHTPNQVVEELNNIFSRFDDAVSQAGLTKIKTIGDSYMVAAGIPDSRTDHAIVLTRLALSLQKIAGECTHFKFRIGINSGSAVAGIIGKKIFLYDLWGDTVNTASRLEQYGEAGRINVGKNTYELIKNHFICTLRGSVSSADSGSIPMYFVEGEKK